MHCQDLKNGWAITACIIDIRVFDFTPPVYDNFRKASRCIVDDSSFGFSFMDYHQEIDTQQKCFDHFNLLWYLVILSFKNKKNNLLKIKHVNWNKGTFPLKITKFKSF